MYPPDKPEEEPKEAIKRLHKNLEEDLDQAWVYAPSPEAIKRLQKNLEEEPLVRRIKVIEERLLKRRGDYWKDYTDKEKAELRKLLELFEELATTKYGALNYIIKTGCGEIEALYDVNTSIDFTVDLDEVKIRIPNPKLDAMVAAGGGGRLIGEEARKMYAPVEDARNAKVTDEAIEEIIESIKDILSED